MTNQQILQTDAFLPYQLVTTAEAISRSLAKVYANYDLTTPEWRILVHLNQNKSLTPSELGQYTKMEKARVSRGLVLMEKKALIQRTIDQHDRRITHITLTESGKALFQQVEPHILQWNEQFKQKLGAIQYKQQVKLLKDIEAWCAEQAE